ncbi:hypothetical protein MACK_001297 [Theileria orientalis]|uniref:Uncharacterized protein n=1 Tax=Theileria orientalis TaxID=68886 RepID=A0A976MC64_THEOR|nr:hypothetical protein MACK_001297 [Theileria orientalis]
MPTDTIVSQVSVNTYNNKSSTLKGHNQIINTDLEYVYCDSLKNLSLSDPSGKNEELKFDLRTFNSDLRDRLQNLFSNGSHSLLLEDEAFVYLESLKKFLQNTNISYEQRNLLEFCLLILIFLKNNKKECNIGNVELTLDSIHKFDICPEIVNKIVHGSRLFYKNYGNELELLLNICIWSIEVGNSPNLIQLCYELLIQGLRCEYKSDIVESYIRNSILSRSSVITYISHTQSQYQHVYWNLRILQVALSKKILKEADTKKVREFALNALKLSNKSLYILDETACLLAQIWMIEGVDFDLGIENRLRVLVKLLSVSDTSFLIHFKMDELTKLAISGPLEVRKLSLKCLSLLPEKEENTAVTKVIEKLLYKNNFTTYRSFLKNLDLGILTIGVKYLKDLDSGVKYLNSLHKLTNNIIYGSEVNKSVSSRSSVLEGGTGEKESKIYDYDFVVLLKILTATPLGPCCIKRIIETLNALKSNLNVYYYQIFDLVNAIIATRSYISKMNTMSIDVDYASDLSLYLLLGMDVNFTSIRRDYIRALTISTNHIDFDYINYIMKTIMNIVTRVGGSSSSSCSASDYCNSGGNDDTDVSDNGSKMDDEETQSSRIDSAAVNTVRAYSKWALKIMVSGLCEYLEVFIENNALGIYGGNHPSINKLCKGTITLFKSIVNDTSVMTDLSIVAQMVNVLKGVYQYKKGTLSQMQTVIYKIVGVISESQSGESRFEEQVDGYKEELLINFCSLYEAISCEHLPFYVVEPAVLALVYKQCAGYAARGLCNTITLHATRKILQLTANQLTLLEVHDWDGFVIADLRSLVSLVLTKLKRKHCSLIERGFSHTFKFYSHNFRLTKDSVEKKLKELLEVDLVHLYHVDELKLFESDYTLAPDVVQNMYVSRISRLQVSHDVLSSVPWAGTSRLVCIMDEVARRGPNDQKTWSTLLRRADIILDSFSSNNLSRMAVILTKNSFSDSSFLKRLKSQCLKKAEESDLLSCCGFIYALNKMGLCDHQVLSQFRQIVTGQLSLAKDSYPLVLILNVYCNSKDRYMVMALLSELKGYIASLKPQAFAMIIIDVLSNFSDSEVLGNLEPFILNSLNCIDTMDVRSLVRLYGVFSSTNHPLRDQYLDNLANILSNSIHHATLHQLSTVLLGYTRCSVDTKLLRAVIDSIKLKYESGDLQELLFILSNLLKLNLNVLSLVQDLVDRIVKFKQINGVQLSNLVYLGGKHKLNIPYCFIFEHYQRLKDTFTLRDLTLFAYGMHKLGNLSLHPELYERARQMANNDYNTTSHMIFKKVFKDLN